MQSSGQSASPEGKSHAWVTEGGMRVTVNLTAKAAAALKEMAEASGDTKTDTINRALLIYAYIEKIIRDGGGVYVQEEGSAELKRVMFL